MFFAARVWATRVTERMGLPVRSPEATVLIRLILWSAKQADKILRGASGAALPKAQGVLSTAASMARNTTAVTEVARVLQIETDEAFQLLARCRDAAAALASEAGFLEIASIAARDRQAK